MKSLRSNEGYFILDNRANEGIPDEMMVSQGLPPGSGKGIFEAPTYTCSHCQAVVLMNPNRSRERAYCRGCDHMICDACGIERAKTFSCRTFNQKADELLNLAAKQAGSAPIILLQKGV